MVASKTCQLKYLMGPAAYYTLHQAFCCSVGFQRGTKAGSCPWATSGGLEVKVWPCWRLSVNFTLGSEDPPGHALRGIPSGSQRSHWNSISKLVSLYNQLSASARVILSSVHGLRAPLSPQHESPASPPSVPTPVTTFFCPFSTSSSFQWPLGHFPTRPNTPYHCPPPRQCLNVLTCLCSFAHLVHSV